MAVTRLPIFRLLLLAAAWAVGVAAWADDWSYDSPPAGGRSTPSRPAVIPGSISSARPIKAVSFEDDSPSPEAIERPATPVPVPADADQSPPTSFDDFDGGGLLPIAMPDDLEDMGPAPAPTLSSGRWIDRGRWYSSQEVTFLTRSERKSTTLATDESVPGVLALNQFRTSRGLGFAPGARVTLGAYLGRDPFNRDSAVEFTFFGVNNWSQSRGLTSLGPNELFTVFDPSFQTVPGFIRTNSMEYTYASHFNSYELNARIARRPGRDRMVLTRQGTWVRELSPAFLPTIIGGLRLVTLNEGFNWSAQGTDPTTNFGNYNVRTHNALCGMQIGVDLRYQQESWRAGITGKVGSYVNFADQFTTVNSMGPLNNSTPPTIGTLSRNQSNTATPLSCLGELNVNGAYFFRPNMALRAGYTIILISDLALADKQITFTQTNPVKMSTAIGAAIQGITVGFEFNW